MQGFNPDNLVGYDIAWVNGYWLFMVVLFVVALIGLFVGGSLIMAVTGLRRISTGVERVLRVLEYVEFGLIGVCVFLLIAGLF